MKSSMSRDTSSKKTFKQVTRGHDERNQRSGGRSYRQSGKVRCRNSLRFNGPLYSLNVMV